ncbi:MAG: cell surface protein SprA, partial [Gemmatimonadaceae bacterium]|nr:cell surface protein SprA [Gemmatimonadaceae bacterium]
GRRWRSVRTPLGAAGTDLSRVENLEFWTLIDTAAVRRARNPTMIFDFGDISENTVALAPTRLDVTRTGAGTDTLYSGRRLAGFDTLDTERDQFSRSFNQDRDDNGLAGDVVRALPFATPDSSGVLREWRMCSRGDLRLALLGDTRTNCTVKNARLDEEDVDADNVLNFEATQRESERLFRYVVDFADPRSYTRIGNCNVVQIDTVNGVPEQSTRCWVFFRVPFGAPTDSINGGPTIRRVRALRMTMVSGAAAPDGMFSQVPIARFRLIGAPWLKRGDRALRGIAGEEPAQAFVAASVIGTTDRDSTSGLVYESPPGVVDQPDRQITGLGGGLVQVNERSMRITAGGTLGKFQRAEAFYRFPEGQRNFMQYRQLRVWARGRGRGWGERGELQFFVKAGRDANNFYMYRTPVNAGLGEAAWLPEVRVDFEKLFALRAALQNSFLQGRPDSIACSGVDSLMIARSGLPAGTAIRRFAACSGGYMVYTIDPNVSPPNLAAVQELGVGIIRVDSGTVGGDAPMASDTLELWVDDIRLTDVVNTAGYAGQVGVNLNAADVASFRVNISNRDPFFRGLNEAPSFVSNNGVEMGSNVRLEKFLPAGLGIALPLAISRSSSGSDPYFVSRADIRGDGIQGLRTPRGEATNVSLALRRIGAPKGGLWGAVVDNLSATASWNSARSRSEFQDGRISGVNAGADYLVSAPARVVAMPGWIDKAIGVLPQWMQRAEFVKSLKGGAVRWNPASVRISSTLNRTADRRLSFTKPAEATTDTGRVVSGLAHLLRSVAAVEFRPFNALSGRFDFTSLRDLRDYGDSTSAAIVARGERDRLLGRDLGLERERQLNASIGIQPTISSWMRGRLDIASTFAMQRDPNTRQLVQTEDSLGAFRLPRRASNGRSLSATATLDLPRFLQTYFNDSLTRKRLVPYLLPIDLTWNRGLLSAFDGTAFTPGAAYQFAWGGVDAFRGQEGRVATSAGLNQQFTLSSGLRLPWGVSLTGRSQRALTRGWTRRLDNTQALVEGSQVTYPDLNVRWNWRPSTSFLAKAITQIGTQFRYNDTRQSTIVQPEAATTVADARISRARQLPLNTTITWNIGGGLVTSFSRSVSHRADSLPGSVTEANGKEASGDVSRAFKLPADWKVKSDLRTRMSYQTRRDVAFVQTRGGTGNRSRLTDNGRTAMNINADADVAENLTFSLQGSRILTFDNNFNRRFSQFVMTAVLQISFFAGEIR